MDHKPSSQNACSGHAECCAEGAPSNATPQHTTPCGSNPAGDCCEPGAQERCDEDCLRAIAVIECEESCSSEDDLKDCCTDITSVSGHKHHDHHEKGEACGNHLRAAFEKYASLLEDACCLCRSVLGSRLVKCCASKAHQIHGGAHIASVGLSHGPRKCRRGGKASVDKCCTEVAEVCGSHDDGRGGSISHHSHSPKASPCSRGSCCDKVDYPSGATPVEDVTVDIEKGTNREHVSITAEGMTCSGCGNKLQRSLESLPSVKNVSVNFIMKRAEFEIDPSVTDAGSIITKAQQMTGFSLTKISTTDHTLEFLTTAASARTLAARTLAARTLPGVTSITPLKSSVRIAYNPTTIGARTLATSIGNLTTGLAPPPTTTDPAVSTGLAHFRALTLKTLAAATLTTPVAVLAWAPHLAPPRIRGPVSLALATLVQAVAVPEFYAPALRSLRRRRAVEMDMLVVVGVSAAYAYSVVAFAFAAAGAPLATGAFFETSALLVTLILLGRLVGAWARVRAVAAVSVRGGQARTAVVVEDGVEREVDARLLQYGDVFRVAPHSKVPTDGVVVVGVSEVDESVVTGETLPVVKGPGSAVVAGTVNGEGALTVRLGRLPGSNTVTDIAELVEDAFKTKPRVQELADKVAGWFIWVVGAVAVVVLCMWVAVALRVRDESGAKVVDTALSYCIAVLAVSCPCALGLAVPMVLIIAGGVAARGGVVIKSAQSVERARKITDVVFDKTGTLTMQELNVVAEETLAGDPFESASLARALVSGNNHPVSAAVAKHLEAQNLDPPDLENSRVIPGSGVTAIWNGSEIRAGNARWTRSEDHPTVRRLTSEGMTVLCVTKAAQLAAVYGLKSVLRPEAVAVISKLRGKNIAIHLVSGDERRAVEAVRAAVGIPQGNTVSRQTPADKRIYVRRLMEDGKVTLFCGDGTNDAVAIAQADVGVQVGSSSDVSRATADVVLLSGLEGITFLLDISAASFRRIVFNFVWSATYNVFAILLAAGAFVRVRIPPAYAGLGELVSVLPVIFAAFTMSGIKRRK